MKSLLKPNLIIRLFTKLSDGGWIYVRADETDQQMLTRVGIQFVVLFLIITLFDDFLDLILGTLHFVFELMHLLFEVIEGFMEINQRLWDRSFLPSILVFSLKAYQ